MICLDAKRTQAAMRSLKKGECALLKRYMGVRHRDLVAKTPRDVKVIRVRSCTECIIARPDPGNLGSSADVAPMKAQRLCYRLGLQDQLGLRIASARTSRTTSAFG
jgi:hypothetical protein